MGTARLTKGILMDTKTKREERLHYIMSFVGGIFAIYALLEYSNVFGSAETSNMIVLVENFLHWEPCYILIRLGNLFIYALGIIFTMWCARYHHDLQKRISIVIDAIAAVLLSFFPKDIHPVIALYPVAFAMSIQWCTFRGVCGNPSATTFSTGNFRQLVSNAYTYFTEKSKESLFKAKFYLCTLLSFHAGVATVCIIRPYMLHSSIWLAFVPLIAAMIQVSVKDENPNLLGQSCGCEEV